MTKLIPKISDAEWRIMKILWEKSPQTSNQIIEKLSGKVDWSPKTIKTLVNRLATKNAVRFEKEQRSYLYYPNVQESECQRSERKSFLGKVYGGSLKPLIAAFLEDENLTTEEINELKQILARKDKDNDSNR